MSFITKSLDKELQSIKNKYINVENSFADYPGSISYIKKTEIRTTLDSAYLYLCHDDIFAFGILKYLPKFIRLNISKNNYELIQTYQELRRLYALPYAYFELYIDFLELKTKVNFEKINNEIASFYSKVSDYANEYIDINTIVLIKSCYCPLYEKICKLDCKDLFIEFINYFNDIDHKIELLNKAYIDRELISSDILLSNIDGKSLDYQQRLVVVSHDTHTLVLAGAGSGKTLTLAAKVKYLVEIKKMDPKDILLISFTAKSAEEMKHRINEKLGINVDVMTFHKLGLKIISQTNGYKPDISDDPNEIIKSYFKKEILENSEVIDAIIEYLSFYIGLGSFSDEVKSLGDIIEKSGSLDNETIKSKISDKNDEAEIEILRKQKTTIKKEMVKSMEEVQIANFLYLNGIEYEYEKSYEINTRTLDFRQYKPDFYLTDYGIYIEHFGMNKDFRVPWLSPSEEMKYIDGYHWKIRQHEINNTKLIQTFSYFNKEGTLINKLKEQLESHNIKFYERDRVELYKKLYLEKKDTHFDELIKLISTFILLLKSNKYGQENIEQFINEANKIEIEYLKKRTLCFLEIVRYVFYYYQQKLQDNEMIDFNDMLSLATDMVESNAPIHSYKMIIIDEFQDTSIARYRLILSLLKRTQSKLLCVGDDWQSIYRFAGSDLKVFSDFKVFFGSLHLLRIENTYRNPQNLIDIAGEFVMKNPMQFKKNLTSVVHNDEVPITIIGYNEYQIDALLEAIDDIVERKPNVKEILLIGRNNFDIKFLENQSEFRINNNSLNNIGSISYSKYRNIKFSFLTAHRSKGLEAEVTILLNVNNSTVGFPNQIADDPILDYVLTQKDEYLFGEERRLFYVALTRTKSFTYILTKISKRSVFVSELIEKHKVPYYTSKNLQENEKVVKCPRCKNGDLVERTYRDKKFLGCSNYKNGCDFTTNEVQILVNPMICPRCGSYLVYKRNSYSQLYRACIDIKYCRYNDNPYGTDADDEYDDIRAKEVAF